MRGKKKKKRERLYSLQSLQYFLPGPLQERFADLCLGLCQSLLYTFTRGIFLKHKSDYIYHSPAPNPPLTPWPSVLAP